MKWKVIDTGFYVPMRYEGLKCDSSDIKLFLDYIEEGNRYLVVDNDMKVTCWFALESKLVTL